MKLNIICNIFSTSGYAVHSRALANTLSKYHDVRISTPLPQNWELLVSEKERELIKKSDEEDRINIIIDVPWNWKVQCNKKINIGFLVWEGDKLPESFKEYIKAVEQVWVPSNHVYNAVKNVYSIELWEKIKHKLFLVPHGVNLEVFKPIENKIERPFTFLMNKGFRHEYDRGGVQFGVRAFIEEFDKTDNVRLIIKFNPAYMNPNLLDNLIKKYYTESNKEPKIAYVLDVLNENQMNELYNQSDIFLNPTCAEAFSLPCLEAMATGRSVITTNYGGQTDYVDNSNGFLIDYELKEVKHDIMYEGIKWAQVNIEELKKVMRSVYVDRNLLPTRQEMAIQTSKSLTWENSALKANQALSALGGISGC